jgi:hypothetical protein
VRESGRAFGLSVIAWRAVRESGRAFGLSVASKRGALLRTLVSME